MSRNRRMRRLALTSAALFSLLFAGGASAYALKTIWLRPGRCTNVHGTKICARKVAPRTVTVAPSPIGKTISGNGSQTLDPMTLAHGVEVHWTSSADSYGDNSLSVYCGINHFDNGNGATSGQSYLPAGTYTCNLIASAAWSLSF